MNKKTKKNLPVGPNDAMCRLGRLPFSRLLYGWWWWRTEGGRVEAGVHAVVVAEQRGEREVAAVDGGGGDGERK